jgi:type I restriction-modification system DNA methylase subunit
MSSLTELNNIITQIRDILRSREATTGMDSLTTISLYILSRYLTSDRIKNSTIPTELSWESMKNTLTSQDGDVKSLEKYMVEFIQATDREFHTHEFAFKVKKPAVHKEIIQLLETIQIQSINEVANDIDILGLIYENLLGTGSSSASRDLGQYFTDRSICKYMTELCNPQIINGVPESVIDPTMGTGGFLTSYLKHFEGKVDWNIHQKEIHGVDHDKRVAGFARLNMFIESNGKSFKNLKTDDSLCQGLTPTTYDVILANMPFGLKGLKYTDCCESIKKLKISGTKSEPLFLQLMMVSLRKNGRCAVVVPDGVLINNSKCHIGTREYLLDNFELKRVIKMKGKLFTNTSILPSILFFENSGNPTTTVEFWDIEKNEKNEIVETKICSVQRNELDDTDSLDSRKYQKVDINNNDSKFPIVKLGDVCEIINGATKKSSLGTDVGKYPLYYCSILGNLYLDSYDYDGIGIIINKTNGSGKSMVYCGNGKYNVGQSTLHFKSKDPSVRTLYIYYYLLNNKDILEKNYVGTNQKSIHKSDLFDIKIEIPPIEIQDEIVKKIQSIENEIIDIENRKKTLIEDIPKILKSIS